MKASFYQYIDCVTLNGSEFLTVTCTFLLESFQYIFLSVILKPLGDQDTLVVLTLAVLQTKNPHRRVMGHPFRSLYSSPATTVQEYINVYY